MSKKTREARRERRFEEHSGNGKARVIEPEVVDAPRIEVDPSQMSSTALVSGGFIPSLWDDLHATFSEAAERSTAAVERLKKISSAEAEFLERMARLAEEKHSERVKQFKERGL